MIRNCVMQIIWIDYCFIKIITDSPTHLTFMSDTHVEFKPSLTEKFVTNWYGFPWPCNGVILSIRFVGLLTIRDTHTNAYILCTSTDSMNKYYKLYADNANIVCLCTFIVIIMHIHTVDTLRCTHARFVYVGNKIPHWFCPKWSVFFRTNCLLLFVVCAC